MLLESVLISGQDVNANFAPGEGFEPSLTTPKAVVLPLDDPGKFGT
jgi:hypothetical protein